MDSMDLTAFTGQHKENVVTTDARVTAAWRQQSAYPLRFWSGVDGRTVALWLRRYSHLRDLYPDDALQTIYLACLVAGDDPEARNRQISRQLEQLSRDAGWRRVVIDGRRVWVSEWCWLYRKVVLGTPGVGAPRGNRNKAGKPGRNQYTREQS